MGSARFRLTGVNELRRAFRQLPKRTGERVLRNTARAGARVIQSEIKDQAPRQSGELQSEIIIRQDKSRKDAVVFAVGPSTKAFHGMFQEFGTVHQPANPFVRRALALAEGRALLAMVKTLRRAMLREAKKVAGPLTRKQRRRL